MLEKYKQSKKIREKIRSGVYQQKQVEKMSRGRTKVGQMLRLGTFQPKKYEGQLGQKVVEVISNEKIALKSASSEKLHDLIFGKRTNRFAQQAALMLLAENGWFGEVNQDYINRLGSRKFFEQSLQNVIDYWASRDIGNIGIPMMKNSGIRFLLNSANPELRNLGETGVLKAKPTDWNNFNEKAIEAILNYQDQDGNFILREQLNNSGILYDLTQNPNLDINARTRETVRKIMGDEIKNPYRE